MNDDVRQSIARLAQLAAQLADPFAERARVLAASGLDEPQWHSLQSRWHTELQRRVSHGDSLLIQLYQQRFAEERARLAAARVDAASVAPVSGAASQPVDSVRARDSVDSTALATPMLAPALPFRGSVSAPRPIESPASQQTEAEGSAAKKDSVDETVLLDDDSAAARRILPFDDESGS